MRGPTSAIRRAQLYCQLVPSDQVLLCRSNWFHTGEIASFQEIFSWFENVANNLHRRVGGFSLHNKTSWHSYLLLALWYRDASDTAGEPLGGLKGHPALLWRDW
jgi:hypothetical protein